MKCEVCQQEDATVHLTQVLDGSVKKLHLCESCASESGVDLHNPVSIADLLLGLGAETGADRKPAAAGASCAVCGLKSRSFQQTGRLGCPACYETFASRLTPLIRAMQRGDRHVGKTPGGGSSARPADVAELRRDLERAVAEERYEDAATLRDRLAAATRECATQADAKAAPP